MDIKELLEELKKNLLSEVEDITRRGFLQNNTGSREELDPLYLRTRPDGSPTFLKYLDNSTNPPTLWVQFPENYSELPAQCRTEGTNESFFIKQFLEPESNPNDEIKGFNAEDKAAIKDALEIYEVLLGIDIKDVKDAPEGTEPAIVIFSENTPGKALPDDSGFVLGRATAHYMEDFALPESDKEVFPAMLIINTGNTNVAKEELFLSTVLHEFEHTLGFTHTNYYQSVGRSIMTNVASSINYQKLLNDSEGRIGVLDVQMLLDLRTWITGEPVDLGKDRKEYYTSGVTTDFTEDMSIDEDVWFETTTYYYDEGFKTDLPKNLWSNTNAISVIDQIGKNTIKNNLGEGYFYVEEDFVIFTSTAPDTMTDADGNIRLLPPLFDEQRYFVSNPSIDGGKKGNQFVFINEISKDGISMSKIEALIFEKSMFESGAIFDVSNDGKSLVITKTINGEQTSIIVTDYFFMGAPSDLLYIEKKEIQRPWAIEGSLQALEDTLNAYNKEITSGASVENNIAMEVNPAEPVSSNDLNAQASLVAPRRMVR